jgi:hypothetical protein
VRSDQAPLPVLMASQIFATLNRPVPVPGVQSVVFDIIRLLAFVPYEALSLQNDVFLPTDKPFLLFIFCITLIY